VIFLQNLSSTFVDDSWVPLSPGPDLGNDEPPIGSLQFTVSDVGNALLELDSSKGPGPYSVPPLILKNCTSAFALPLVHALQQVIGSVYFPRWMETLVCYSHFQEW
jgi:hypothetical protein